MNSVHPLNPYKINPFAEIAQLVEHDLAKVGVASSSLVFRSNEARQGFTRAFKNAFIEV